MTLEPFHGKISKKAKSSWKEPANIIAVISILALIITFVVGAIMTNSANERADKLQSITSNFKTTIVPYVIEANLGIFNVTTNSTYRLNNYGNITLSLIVFTPHALILNISDPRYATTFTFRNSTTPVNGKMLPILDLAKLDSTIILVGPLAEQPPESFVNSSYFPSAVPPFFQQYEAFVQSGVTQVNFTIPIYGNFPLNPKVFIDSGQAVPFGFATSLANFKVSMNVFDVQTGTSSTESYSGTLDVWIWANPPFTSPPF